MTQDLNKGILANGIQYNHLNLPKEVKFNNSNTKKIEYFYDATGIKQRKIVTDNTTTTTTDYAGNYIYEKVGNGAKTLQFFNHPEGYVTKDGTGFKYVYQYKDHLGNIRLSYTDNNGTLEIIEEKNYYPFGLTHQGYNTHKNLGLGSPAASKYGYNGKELQDDVIGNNSLDLYDYHARQYDPAIGRMTSVDPHAESYPSISPYAYVANNPIMYIDPDGRDIVVPNKADRAAVLKMINSKALGLYAFDKSGKLYQARSTGDASRYSKYYADRLNAAIKDNQTIEIRIEQTRDAPTAVSNGKGGYKLQHNSGTAEDIDTKFGGGSTTTVNGGKGDNVLLYISGNENKNLKDTKGNQLEDKPTDILAHELVGHAIPYIVGTDTGNAVDNENKVRKEVKKKGQTGPSPLRKAEPTHKE